MVEDNVNTNITIKIIMVTMTKLWLEDIGSGGKATADNCRFSFSRHFHFLKLKRKMQIIESISLFIFDWIEEKNNNLYILVIC